MMKILHVGVHDNKNKNSGDTVLFEMVRRAFDSMSAEEIVWKKRQIWDPITQEDVKDINTLYDAIIIGGGGLLLRDQIGADASKSGWQWNCSIKNLKAIKTPIVVFAIGYNRFRGQPDFLTVFDEHISTLIEKSVFFSLRNNGSIHKIKGHVPSQLHPKIKKQTCPTTIISRLSKNFLSGTSDSEKPIVAINAAFDRVNLRISGNMREMFGKFNEVINLLEQSELEPVIVAHKTDDANILNYLDSNNAGVRVVDLTDRDYLEIIDFYRSVSLSIGMRGHSQMIPLGLEKPIFSIITHDKMQFLLDDIGHPSWGAELEAHNFIDLFYAYLQEFLTNKPQLQKDINLVLDAIQLETSTNVSYAVSSIKNRSDI